MNEAFIFDPPDPRKAPVSGAEGYRKRYRVRNLLTSWLECDDERREELLREIQLLGVDVLPDLRFLATSDNSFVSHLAGRAIRMLVPDEIGIHLVEGLTKDEDRYPVELGAVLLARLEQPDLEVKTIVSAVDRLSQKAQLHIAESLDQPIGEPINTSNTLDVLFRLGEFWREEGFQGNTEDYYDPRNSWLPDVLERRMGMPISLSVLYVALCTRLGLRAEGVGMPFHFIVRVQVATRDAQGFIFIDPFHGARPLDLEDCQKLVESSGHTFNPEEHLKATSARDVLIRMCNNLLVVYDHQNKMIDSERVATILQYLSPQNPVPFLIRAERRIRRGALTLAREDLQGVLSLDPSGPLAQAANQMLKRMEYGLTF